MTVEGPIGPDEPGARARLVRRIVYAAVGMLIGLAAGIGISTAQPQRYESTMQLLVGPVGADRSTLDASGLLSRTYADLLTSRNAVNRAADSLGVTVEEGDVTAIADDKSRVILLVVQSDDPTAPPRLATTLAADLIVLVDGSQNQTGEGAADGLGPGQVRVLDDATDPAQPLNNRSALTLIGSSLLGAALGLAIGALAPRSRRRPIDRQYLELIGMNVISLEQVTSTRSRKKRRFFSRKARRGDANKRDEYELIVQLLLVACAKHGDFTTVLFIPVTDKVENDSAELIRELAEAAHRLSCPVELADIDPAHRLLDRVDDVGKYVVIANPLDLNTESGVRRIARLARSSVENLMFLASPAVETSVRALTGSSEVDRIVLVARAGQTERREFRELLNDLTSLDLRPAAVLQLGSGKLVPADASAPPANQKWAPVTDSVDGAGSDTQAGDETDETGTRTGAEVDETSPTREDMEPVTGIGSDQIVDDDHAALDPDTLFPDASVPVAFDSDPLVRVALDPVDLVPIALDFDGGRAEVADPDTLNEDILESDALDSDRLDPDVDGHDPDALDPDVDGHDPEALDPDADGHDPEVLEPDADGHDPDALDPDVDWSDEDVVLLGADFDPYDTEADDTEADYADADDSEAGDSEAGDTEAGDTDANDVDNESDDDGEDHTNKHDESPDAIPNFVGGRRPSKI